jgi:hypothetical protein
MEMATLLAGHCKRWKMSTMPTAGVASVASLVAMRYLSPAARARWSRDRVFFQIDELNALIAPLLRRTSNSERTRRLARAQARARLIRTAASWTAAVTTAEAWAYLATNLDEPEDAFGPAFLLKALLPEDPRTLVLLATLPPAIERVLGETS